MGRPERRIDPEAGPVQAFAAELRDLRERAGRPKYAALANRTGKSQTALAEAAGGRRLPTWETVAAYVTGCRGDLDHWHRRWQEVSAELESGQPSVDPDQPVSPDQSRPGRASGTPDTEDRQQVRPPVGGSSAGADAPADTDHVPGRTDDGGNAAGTVPRWSRRRVALLAGGLAAVAAVAATTLLVVPMLTDPKDDGSVTPDGGITATAQPADGGAEIAVADEADPKDSGCADDPDVLSVDSVELALDRRPVGLLELRYAPRCGVAWPRFLPLGDGPPAEGTTVHVDVVRPADGRRAAFAMPYAGTSVFGNVLRSTRHCVIAEARLDLLPDAGATPMARTACYRGRVRDGDGGTG